VVYVEIAIASYHGVVTAPACEWDQEYAEFPPLLEEQLQLSGCALLRNTLVCDAAQTFRAYHRLVDENAGSPRACSLSLGVDVSLERSECTGSVHGWAADVFESLKPAIGSARERGISAIVLISPCFADTSVADAFRDRGLRATGYTVYALAPARSGTQRLPNPNVLEMTAHLPIRYRVVNVDRLFDTPNAQLKHFVDGRRVFVVADERVMDLYGDRLTAYFTRGTQLAGLMTMKGHEREKHWKNVERVCARAFESSLERSSVMIAVGGGIVMDVVGVAACLYRRGIDYLRVPTTLIGMVDVAVGIKHGFNFNGKKNALGSFYPPLGAVVDRHFLATLDERHLLCGLAEILKLGIICEPALFDIIEEHGVPLVQTRFASPAEAGEDLIVRAQAAMMHELEQNLFEREKRRLADFGHTISPALEAASRYRIHHGEAVAIDAMFSCAIALIKGLLSIKDFERVRHLYAKLELPAVSNVVTPELVEDAFEETRRHRGGDLNLVVPTAIGRGAFIQRIRADEIRAALSMLGG
jgi:3-dehydroquinate synthase